MSSQQPPGQGNRPLKSPNQQQSNRNQGTPAQQSSSTDPPPGMWIHPITRQPAQPIGAFGGFRSGFGRGSGGGQPGPNSGQGPSAPTQRQPNLAPGLVPGPAPVQQPPTSDQGTSSRTGGQSAFALAQPSDVSAPGHKVGAAVFTLGGARPSPAPPAPATGPPTQNAWALPPHLRRGALGQQHASGGSHGGQGSGPSAPTQAQPNRNVNSTPTAPARPPGGHAVPIVAPPASTTTPTSSAPAAPANQPVPRVPIIPVTTHDISPDQLLLQSAVHNRPGAKDAKGNLDYMHDKGIRTDFGQSARKSEILTNFFEITNRPTFLFVYKAVFIREYGQDAKPVYVKNRFDKQALFEQMIRSFNITRRDCWVTDNDMIWSTQRLLDNETFDISPKVVQNLSATNANSFKVVTCEEAHLSYDRAINMSKTVGELFHFANGRTDGVDDPAVLARGLNAIITKHARARIPNGIISTSANKFYATHPEADLSSTLRALHGFAASVRPGNQRLLLNVSTKCSPFLKNMAVSKFIDEHGSSRMGPIAAALKGVKVKITYQSNPDLKDAQRIKFITGIGSSLDVQTIAAGGTVWNYYQQPSFPNRPLTPLDKDSWAINVGGKPSKANDDKDKDGGKNQKQAKPEWYPSEYLEIVDIPSYRDKLTGDQTTQMINLALKFPQAQREDIETKGLAMFGLLDDKFKADLQSSFGLSVSADLLKVPCRFLPAPRVTYGGNKPAYITRASWNLKDVQVRNAGQIVRVPILDLSRLRQARRNDPFLAAEPNAIVRWSPQQEARSTLPSKFLDYMEEQIAGLGIAGVTVDGPHRPSLVRQDRRVETYDIDEAKLERIFRWAVSQNTKAPKTKSDQITLIVVMPQQAAGLYSSIKRVGDLRMGLQTICCAVSKMQDFGKKVRGIEQGPQHCGNLALKINMKGRGDNHVIARSDFPELYANYVKGKAPSQSAIADTIVFGADVTHPMGHCAPGCPSIAGVVASIDDNFAQFPGSMRLQRSRQEKIEDLQDMVKERLLAWADRHQETLPTSILFYRDGVSESQFDKIREHEIAAVNEGYELAKAELDLRHIGDLGSGPEDPDNDDTASTSKFVGEDVAPDASKAAVDSVPIEKSPSKPDPSFKLTFVVVGKRHNTRFYPQAERAKQDSWDTPRGPNGNVLPGCVVDQGITHPYIFDFYLQSHQPLRGTGRSAHYFVLQNNMKLSADRLQSITHSFCYNYARATKGVSYCAPAYYADRLCNRRRAYIRNWLIGVDNVPRERQPNESADAFNDYVKNYVRDTSYYRPHQGPSQNPWQPSMGDTMFYL